MPTKAQASQCKSSWQAIPNLVNSTTWSRPRCGSMTPKIIGLEYTVVHWPYVNRMVSYALFVLSVIKDLSTFSTISGSRNLTISTVSGSRNCFVHFYNFWIQKLQYFCGFWIQKLHHFYNFWIQNFFGPYSQFLDPETAVFLRFLDPETAPFLQFLDHQMSPRECPSSSVTHQWVRSC